MDGVYVRWLFDLIAPVVYAAMGVVGVPLVLFVAIASFQQVFGGNDDRQSS